MDKLGWISEILNDYGDYGIFIIIFILIVLKILNSDWSIEYRSNKKK